MRQDLSEAHEEFLREAAAAPGLKRADFAAFHIESRCHLRCIHCFARDDYRSDSPEKALGRIVRIINRLALMFDRIQLTGGEVFLRRDPSTRKNDLPILIGEINRRRREPILQTTGMFLDNRMIAHARNHGTRWVSLSLDGPDIESNNRIRGRDSAFTDVLAVIPRLKAAGLQVKVGTCVTSVTKDVDELARLGLLLASLEVDNWKLTQFFAYEVGRASYQNRWLSVTSDEFSEIVTLVSDRLAGAIPIAAHPVSDSSRSPCAHIYPEGKLAIQKGFSEIPLGNVLHDSPTRVAELFSQHGVYDTVAANGQKTYIPGEIPQWIDKIGSS